MDTQPSHALHPADFEAILSHPSRASAVNSAIALCRAAWSILYDELRAVGYDGETPNFEDGSAYQQYREWDDQLLEAADAVYHGSTAVRQKDDDQDLEHFEARFEVHDDYSPRVKALALRTIARDLVAVAKTLSEKEIGRAVSMVIVSGDGAIDDVSTFRSYVPHFALDW